MRIPTIQTVNARVGFNTPVGASINTHAQDEQFALQEQTQRNETRSLVKGVMDVASVGGEFVKAYQNIRAKEKKAQDQVDAQNYMNGLEKTTAQFMESIKTDTDTETWNKRYGEALQAYHDEASNGMSNEALNMVHASAMKYKSDNDIRIMQSGAKRRSHMRLADSDATIKMTLDNVTLETIPQQFEKGMTAYQNKKMDMVITPKEEELFAKQYHDDLKIHAYEKTILTGDYNKAKMTAALLKKDNTLDYKAKFKLEQEITSIDRQHKSELYSDLVESLQNGEDISTALESKELDVNGNPVITSKMRVNLIKQQKILSNQKRVEASRKEDSQWNGIMKAIYDMPVDDPKYNENIEIAKKHLMENGTYYHVKAFDDMVKNKGKALDAVKSLPPEIQAELKINKRILQKNQSTQGRRINVPKFKNGKMQFTQDLTGKGGMIPVFDEGASFTKMMEIEGKLVNYAISKGDSLKSGDLTRYRAQLTYPYEKEAFMRRAQYVAPWFSTNYYQDRWKHAKPYDENATYENGDVVKLNGKIGIVKDGKLIPIQ